MLDGRCICWQYRTSYTWPFYTTLWRHPWSLPNPTSNIRLSPEIWNAVLWARDGTAMQDKPSILRIASILDGSLCLGGSWIDNIPLSRSLAKPFFFFFFFLNGACPFPNLSRWICVTNHLARQVTINKINTQCNPMENLPKAATLPQSVIVKWRQSCP